MAHIWRDSREAISTEGLWGLALSSDTQCWWRLMAILLFFSASRSSSTDKVLQDVFVYTCHTALHVEPSTEMFILAFLLHTYSSRSNIYITVRLRNDVTIPCSREEVDIPMNRSVKTNVSFNLKITRRWCVTFWVRVLNQDQMQIIYATKGKA